MSKKTLKFLNDALNESNSSELLMKHGCVLVKNGKIIERGHNFYRNRTKDGFLECNCSCHAEINVIRKAYYRHKFNINIKNLKGSNNK